MYDKLTNDFKHELIDRRLNKMIISSFSMLFLIYTICSFILWGIYNHWLVILISNLVLIILCGIFAYTIIFIAVKKKENFFAKDYFHYKCVIKSLKNISKKDVDILLQLIKVHKINTRPKIQEALRHYQVLLLRKSNKSFTIISVLSLTISTIGIILSAVNYQNNKDLILLLILIFSIIICVTLVCICVKIINKLIYYNLSEYALYERIEAALSEIWMTKKL